MVKTILVIEDEAQTREIFLRCLKFEKFEGIGAENGSNGIRLAERHRPDLIVCDIMMPDMDGYEVLSSLRKNDATASIPFIFLTAKVTMSDLRQGMTSGADDYLTKPCTVENFLDAIASRLSRQADLKRGLQAAVSRATAPQSHNQLPNVANPDSIFPDCPRLTAVFEFIESHYQQSIHLTDVAQSVGYSPAYLTNLSQSHTGRTVKAWIIERRMAQARQLLASTAESIKQIADSIGYDDAGYFTRQFRKLHGVTPQVWRSQTNR
ncbi:response regulator transcription factor [Leptothoe sp. PORK10 BA2]|uniref:response regulator transcription factor n=1 Tax=Leptothoe sp. PORK10 BA2 TaxID=3110254 RepID=UPI002B20A97F|nr:response regulator [Leptothoe sp. PORK10 BA2]MEA5465333.1 response regulator [Leptothoe sp. PORK10 BA2]